MRRGYSNRRFEEISESGNQYGIWDSTGYGGGEVREIGELEIVC